MPKVFTPAPTAEQIISVIDAVVALGNKSTSSLISDFTSISAQRTVSALSVGKELGLLELAGQTYSVASNHAKLISTSNPMQQSALLRLALEGFQPFIVFRDRLRTTKNADTAVRQTCVALGISDEDTEVFHTLTSLGTYCQVLVTTGSGEYEIVDELSDQIINALFQTSSRRSELESAVKVRLPQKLLDVVSYQSVIDPLANALGRAIDGDSRGAVVEAGNAVESAIAEIASSQNFTLSGHGINSKLNSLKSAANLPTKIWGMGQYLGHIRNAADHGIDTETGSSWTISVETGQDFVSVSLSFLSAVGKSLLDGTNEL